MLSLCLFGIKTLKNCRVAFFMKLKYCHIDIWPAEEARNRRNSVRNWKEKKSINKGGMGWLLIRILFFFIARPSYTEGELAVFSCSSHCCCFGWFEDARKMMSPYGHVQSTTLGFKPARNLLHGSDLHMRSSKLLR